MAKYSIPYESLDPLTMAAKRHANDPRRVLEVFRSLDCGRPSEEQIEDAARKVA